MQSLTPGQSLGARFTLLRRLAERDGAQLWLAEDGESGERVALKIVEAARLSAPGTLQRLREELAQAGRLDPGQAVQLFGLHEAGDLVLLAMEYLPGGDLGQFRGRPFAAYARHLEEVARILEAAHERGLVHGGLRCSRVLLDDAGGLRLAGFGAAMLSTGQAPYNASPQQLRGEPDSPADDLYAFGVLLYELLSGHPPFFPDFMRDRVLHDPVPPLVPRAPAPDRLRLLALRLLSKSAAARPAGMGELRTELAAALAEPEDAQLAPAVPASGAAADVTPAAAAGGAGRGRLVAVAAVILAGLLAVFVWLPERVAERAAVEAREATAAALAAAEQARNAQLQGEAQAQARSAALASRDAFAAALEALEQRSAAVWATAALAAARAAGEGAARDFDLGHFDAAGEAWDAALAALEDIESGQPAGLSAALAAGEEALARGQADAARKAFELALAIEPGNAAATRGLARAATLDEVFALLDAAARAEQAGRLEEALDGLRAALELDAAAPGAREAVARIESRRADEAFAALMSRGMAAMAAGRHAEAGQVFEQAQALRPGSREAADALEELARTRKADGLQALTGRAEAAERAEDWAGAVQAWSDALAIEPTLAAARAGLARSRPRAALAASLDGLVVAPDKLWSDAGKAEAEGLLAAAASAPPPRERLSQRAAELAALLDAARRPVILRLESDGRTEVVIYRVGRIGAFERHDVELIPGRYGIVGTRRGYRDVRRDVEIAPGKTPAPVVVQCEEPI